MSQQDHVRVLRVIEYSGPRDKVEDCVARSLHGEKRLPGGLVIRAATVGAYPEVLDGLPATTGYPGEGLTAKRDRLNRELSEALDAIAEDEDNRWIGPQIQLWEKQDRPKELRVDTEMGLHKSRALTRIQTLATFLNCVVVTDFNGSDMVAVPLEQVPKGFSSFQQFSDYVDRSIVGRPLHERCSTCNHEYAIHESKAPYRCLASIGHERYAGPPAEDCQCQAFVPLPEESET